MPVKFEIYATADVKRDCKYSDRLSKEHAEYIMAQMKSRTLQMGDKPFFDLQETIALRILKLERYYKYGGKSGLPAGVDKTWSKFLLLWNMRAVFSEKQCGEFLVKMREIVSPLKEAAPQPEIYDNFVKLGLLFNQAAKLNRQVIYGSF